MVVSQIISASGEFSMIVSIANHAPPVKELRSFKSFSPMGMPQYQPFVSCYIMTRSALLCRFFESFNKETRLLGVDVLRLLAQTE